MVSSFFVFLLLIVSSLVTYSLTTETYSGHKRGREEGRNISPYARRDPKAPRVYPRNGGERGVMAALREGRRKPGEPTGFTNTMKDSYRGKSNLKRKGATKTLPKVKSGHGSRESALGWDRDKGIHLSDWE